jgi:predicted aldo/keto reductase-like oxidoreductase
LLQFHEVIRTTDPGRVMDAGGAMEAAVRAQKAGKVRFIGFTGHKSPAIHLAMLQRIADAGLILDTVQMPLNVMDAHFDSFEREVLPVAAGRNMGIIAMKPMGGGHILKAGVVSPIECLHYAMNLPVSVVVTGCDSMPVLDQAIEAATTFKPLSSDQRMDLLSRTAPSAQGGKLELYKTTEHFDGTAQHPEWLG